MPNAKDSLMEAMDAPQNNAHLSKKNKKKTQQREEHKVINAVAHNNIQQWSAILTLIKFNPIPFPFYFCISCCTRTPKTWGQLWKRGSNSAQLWKWFTVFPITTPPHSPLQPFCLSLSLSL